MPKRRKSQSRAKRSPIRLPRNTVIALSVILAIAIVGLAGSMVYAANQEEHDSFCASCHTQPESTFFGRAQASTAVDLASSHTSKNTKCIDCHSGPGTLGRVGAMMLGAHNALAWYTHTAVQPAQLTTPISDGNCTKCHPNVTDPSNTQEHFHAFLPRWQAQDPQAASCVDCHGAHITSGTADIGFLDQSRTEAVCQRCHNALGGG
jgi:predicted CXXCH cytochrome family protein